MEQLDPRSGQASGTGIAWSCCMKTTDRRTPSEHDPDFNPDPITGAPGSHPVGTGIGAAGGAMIGAAVGSLGGPVGMAIGGAVGAITGGLAGKEVAESFDPTLETEYWQERYRNESYVEPQYDYDDYGPAYLLGARYRDRHSSFEEAEKDMGEGWERLKDRSRLPWEKARHAARAAWDRREPLSGPGGYNG